MSQIDWSDPEALFDMLVEYTEDEKNASYRDPARSAKLEHLVGQLRAAQSAFLSADASAVISGLQAIVADIPLNFRDDPVVDHFFACLEELQRIQSESGSGR
jgi:hypothetical protein